MLQYGKRKHTDAPTGEHTHTTRSAGCGLYFRRLPSQLLPFMAVATTLAEPQRNFILLIVMNAIPVLNAHLNMLKIFDYVMEAESNATRRLDP